METSIFNGWLLILISYIHVSVVQSSLPRVIVPGTLWCGSGNIAEDEEDLGRYPETDSCCRQHDHCPISIPAYSSDYGLTNTGFFSRSECSCDQEFYQCLKSAKTPKSFIVGKLFFNVLKPQCLTYDHPVIRCKTQMMTALVSACKEYERDFSAPKVWQWNDNWLYHYWVEIASEI